MAITGLLLCGFLIVHLGGNLLLYTDSTGKAYNDYAHKLHSNGELLIVAEVGLFTLFGLHIWLAFKTMMENRAARQVGYRMKASKIKNAVGLIRPDTFMFISGAVVLGFLLLHLVDFKLEQRPGFTYDAYADSPADKAVGILKSPLTLVVYTLGCLALGLHLAHGVSSAFQTLGANHPKYESLIHWGGIIFAVVIAVGFASFPILYGLFQK